MAVGRSLANSGTRLRLDETPHDPDPLPSVDDTNARRVAWETVFNSLSPKEAAKVKSIRIGAVEKLLRKIRVVYDAQSDASLDQLSRSYHGAKLAQYEDLAACMALTRSWRIVLQSSPSMARSST